MKARNLIAGWFVLLVLAVIIAIVAMNVAALGNVVGVDYFEGTVWTNVTTEFLDANQMKLTFAKGKNSVTGTIGNESSDTTYVFHYIIRLNPDNTKDERDDDFAAISPNPENDRYDTLQLSDGTKLLWVSGESIIESRWETNPEGTPIVLELAGKSFKLSQGNGVLYGTYTVIPSAEIKDFTTLYVIKGKLMDEMHDWASKFVFKKK
jgi:hypothetical protein